MTCPTLPVNTANTVAHPASLVPSLFKPAGETEHVKVQREGEARLCCAAFDIHARLHALRMEAPESGYRRQGWVVGLD